MSAEKIKTLTQTIRQHLPEEEKQKHQMDQLLNDLESLEPAKLKQAFSKIPQLVTKLEVEHPKIAESLNEIAVILSNMGI